jgi:hypothetical protein
MIESEPIFFHGSELALRMQLYQARLKWMLVSCYKRAIYSHPVWELRSPRPRPSTIQVTLPSGLPVSTNVLHRSEEYLQKDLLETSECTQQLLYDIKSQKVR